MFNWENWKESAKEAASGATGAAGGVGAIYVCGTTGLSAVGITSGLAVLSAGSMLAGIETAAIIGYGGYKATKYAIDHLSREAEA